MAAKRIAPNGEVIPPGYTYAYGMMWSKEWTPPMIELRLFGDGRKERNPEKIRIHGRNFAEITWGQQNKNQKFDWHPWAETMLDAASKTDYLAVAGCAGSGKSVFYGGPWANTVFLASPKDTLVIVCSTTIKGAEGRIWGYIRDFWTKAAFPLPGKMVDSMHVIYPIDEHGTVISKRMGIHLIAAEKGKEKEAGEKIKGLHAENVLLILDELPLLSKATIRTAIANLSQAPNFQVIGLGNPADYFDPFSELAKPKDGWQSINVDSEIWETERGLALHFDAIKSPNILAGETLYPYLPRTEQKESAAVRCGGENTLAFWTEWRGFWPPSDIASGIYSSSEIVLYGADKSVPDEDWDGTPIGLSGLDLGLVNGGDRCMSYFARFGRLKIGGVCLCFDEYLPINEDIMDKTNPREVQIVMNWRRACESRGVLPHNTGYDASGGGIPYRGWMDLLWSRDIHGIRFHETPSELPVSDTDRTPAKERYVNRVTELWFSGKWMIRNGLIRGIGPDLAAELCERRYEVMGTGGTIRLKAEPKDIMKKRTNGRSPDLADAFAIVIDLVRKKFRFSALHAGLNKPGEISQWKQYTIERDLPEDGFRSSSQSGARVLFAA